MKNIRRAWAVCLGCTLALLVCGGLCINAFSVTQPYILAQNGFTNTQTSMITTACSVTFLLCMFVANAYYEKLGYRVGLTLAVLLGAGSFVLFAEAKTLWSYYLAGMLAGVSYGLGAMLPASILMLRWFSSHRGTAIGICAAGTGVSAVVFSLILSALIERFSLRVCFYFEALVARPATGSGRKKQLALWRVLDRGADFLHAGGDQEHRAHAAGRDPLWRRHSFEHGGLERMGGGFLRRGAAPPPHPALPAALRCRRLGLFLHARRDRRLYGKLRTCQHRLYPLRCVHADDCPVDLSVGQPERCLSAVCLFRKRGFP